MLPHGAGEEAPSFTGSLSVSAQAGGGWHAWAEAIHPERVKARPRATAEAKGFQRLPPARHCALYERGDAALLRYRHPTHPTFSFSLGGEDPAELERLARDFEKRTGLKGRRHG